jgi:ABC-type transport system involved in Fe-S cluster assembly fused permease/ATPase subunit
MKALSAYKSENIRVARSLIVLNLNQSLIVAVGLCCGLLLSYYKINDPDDYF